MGDHNPPPWSWDDRWAWGIILAVAILALCVLVSGWWMGELP